MSTRRLRLARIALARASAMFSERSSHFQMQSTTSDVLTSVCVASPQLTRLSRSTTNSGPFLTPTRAQPLENTRQTENRAGDFYDAQLVVTCRLLSRSNVRLASHISLGF